MKSSLLSMLCALILLCTGNSLYAAEPSDDPAETLDRYIAKPDPAYAYHLRSSIELQGIQAHELELVSQDWRGTPWVHQLVLLKPEHLKHPKQGLLVIVGGSWRENEQPIFRQDREMPGEVAMFLGAAKELGSVIAVVSRVPFQPMYGGLKEDDLIAYTMDQYLDSGDDTWPLLLPMVKSAVRAMDATQAYSRDTWEVPIEHFTVTGASKRGWTTWLTAAADKRVNAIVPIVIDVLNIDDQMHHQKDTWGNPSEMISPYTKRNILERFDTPRGQRMLEIVDPYAYRDRLEHVQKTVLLGTNDRYWTVDAANLYWDGLAGDKRLVYAPNSGHKMKQGILHVLGSLTAAHAAAAEGRALPNPTWSLSREEDGLHFDITSVPAPVGALIWWADSKTRDFRNAVWQSKPVAANTEQLRGEVPRPASGYRAAYISMVFPGTPPGFHASTQIGVFASKAEHDPQVAPR